MRKLLALLWVIPVLFQVAQARIVVGTPESFTLTTRDGLSLSFSNQLEGFTNNDAVVYLVVSGTNKAQKSIRLAPDVFTLQDESGSVVKGLSAKDALKVVVEWNFDRAHEYVRIADSDLRDVLRNENRRYTIERELVEVNLKPGQAVKEKVLFFPRLEKGKYTLALGADKVDILVNDGVYFVKPPKPKGAEPKSAPKKSAAKSASSN